MNTVVFSKALQQTSPPFYQNPPKGKITPIQYKSTLNSQNSELSPRHIRQMKFRKWQAEDYFVQIGQEILRLGQKRWDEHSPSLQGGVKANYKWAIYNWIIEFENLMHWARTDSNHLTHSNFSFHQFPSSNNDRYQTKNNANRRQETNLLQIQQQYINQIESIKNKNDFQKLKLGKCLEFLISNLSTTQFYALQFFLKLLKISQFYISMKAFSQAVSKFQTQYNCFNSQHDTFTSVNYTSKNQQNLSSCQNKAVDQYGEIFYNKNQPQLKKIKSEILNILENYQLSLMISDTNSNWYEIQLCIKLLRIQIYKQELTNEQKEQQFDFVIVNSGIDQTLTKITQIRLRHKNQTFLRKKSTLNVTSLIKINDQILDIATELVQNSTNNQIKINQDSSLQITNSVHQINSENSNSIVEQQTKKIPCTQPHIDTLGFSKSFEVSSSNEIVQQNQKDFYLHEQQIEIKESGFYEPTEKNLLQILEDEKTIRENFSLLSVSEIKKAKKIKKMSRRKQLFKFQCINGKITFRDQSENKNEQKDNMHSIKNKYKERRLGQLEDKKKLQKEPSTKQDSIEEENKHQNEEEQNYNLRDTPEIQKKYQSRTPKSDNQWKSNHKEKSPNVLKNELIHKNQNLPHEQSENYQSNHIFNTPVKDKHHQRFSPIHCSQNQLHSNQIKAIQSHIERPNLHPKKNQEEHYSFMKKDENSNFKSISNQKTMNFKESYKLANNRFAPLSKSTYSTNRFNSKMSFIRKNKNFSRQSRPCLQPSNLQMNYFKKLHQQRFDTKYMASFEEDEFLVDETPPKYKKMKVGNQ